MLAQLFHNKKIYRYAAFGIFGVLSLLVACTFPDYGVTWDEELQNQYGLAVVDYYISGFKDLRYAEIFNLYLYGGMFDGFAAIVDSFTLTSVYDTRHLLNAIFGLLGLWGVWKLGRFLGGDKIGLLALILCAATPVYYGHMFNNPKDIPYAAGIVWTIYHMSRSMTKLSASTLLKLGLVYGLTLGVRVGGVMVFAFWLVPIGLAALLPLRKKCDKEALKKAARELLFTAWRVVLPVGVVAYAIMLICWPWAQQSPIANPLRALSEFSNFPQDVEVLLDGTTYLSTELPWYYAPVYFGIQLPEIMLFLLTLFVLLLPGIWQSMTKVRKQSMALIALTAGVPVLYSIFWHPALYDTVRHFLFVIPLASIAAALGARALWSFFVPLLSTGFRHSFALCLSVIFMAIIGAQVTTMARLHPYEYIYANSFAGGVSGAFGRYESDYWGSSFKEAAQKLQAFVNKEGGVPPGKIYKIAICGPWASAMIYLPPNYEPVVANEPAEFFLATTRWMCQDMRPGKEIIRIERMGAPLSIVKDLRDGYEHYKGNENLDEDK